MIHELEPHIGLCTNSADTVEPAWDSLFLPAPPLLSLSLSLFLSQNKQTKKKKKKDTLLSTSTR